MSKIRVHKNGNFTVMSNFHFKEKGLSLKAKGLLSLMLSLPDSWNYSVAGLVKLSKDGKDSVMSALGELEKFGYLSRERVINSKGQFAGIEYNIYEEPQKEKPIAVKPMEDNWKAENPTEEKPPLLNTNQLRTKNNKNIKELNIYENYGDILEEIDSQELKELYINYLEMRIEIEAPLNPKGLEKLIGRAERLCNGDIALQKAIVEAAVINNWKNVYLPNEQDKENNTTIAEKKRYYGI